MNYDKETLAHTISINKITLSTRGKRKANDSRKKKLYMYIDIARTVHSVQESHVVSERDRGIDEDAKEEDEDGNEIDQPRFSLVLEF